MKFYFYKNLINFSKLTHKKQIKKITTIALAVFCSCICNASTWSDSGSFDTAWYDDLSTSFHISTANELAGLAYLCNNGVSFVGKTINLGNDIDLSGKEWSSISSFDGVFNGNYHKIINLQIDYQDNDFGATRGFVINNLGTFMNVELQGTIALGSRGYGAVSAGGLCVENRGNIYNCITDCIIDVYNYKIGVSGNNHNAGGICVFNKGSIINCANKNNISATPNLHDYRAKMNCAGGISGQNDGEIINCFNYGDIYTIVGYNSSSWSSSRGLPYGYAGGICGYNTGSITNSFSIANIKAEVKKLGSKDGSNSYAGGIVAYSTGNISNTYFSSSKTVEAPNITNEGLKLGDFQLNNTSYNFTDLLNQNVANISNPYVCFWVNSSIKYNNIPFHLDGSAIKTYVENVEQNTATFKATPSDISSSAIVSKGFEYKEKGDKAYKKVNATDDFCVTVSDLKVSATYNLRAFIVTQNSTIYFDEIEFSTSTMIIETMDAANITACSAVLRGRSQSGNTAIKSQGFLWKSENETNYNIVYAEGQNFEYKLENLTPNTLYYYQAFMLTINGDNLYGDIMGFSTQPIAITFKNTSSTSYNEVNIQGYINLNISTDVIIEYKKTTDVVYSKQVVKSNDDGTFGYTLSELHPNTDYDCRAYIIYNNVYTYSQIYTYKTLNVQVQTLAPQLDTTVILRGNVIGATDTGCVGFEYRDANYPDAINSEFAYAILYETSFVSKIENLSIGNEYKYRAFYQYENGLRTFGEWVYFVPKVYEVSVIMLNHTSIEAMVGENIQIIATVIPENATNPAVVWASDNEAVASVSEDGLVTLLAEGKAVITATAADNSGVSASCEVTVNKIAQTIEWSQEFVDIKLGEQIELTAVASSGLAVSYESSNPEIAQIIEVDGKVFVNCLALGEVIITASQDGNDKYLAAENVVKSLEISPIYVEEIVLDRTAIEGYEGETIQLSATVSPDNATNPAVVWASDNVEVATVTEDGLVALLAVGEANITATTADGSGVSANCKVTVLKLSGIGSAGVGEASVKVVNGEIIISGVAEDVEIEVYNIKGQLVYAGTERRIALTAHNVYVVKITNKLFRVSL